MPRIRDLFKFLFSFFIYCVIAAVTAFPLICTAAPVDEFQQRLPKFAVGAHQGGIFGPHFPNTLKQFEAAKNAGADIVEMDLRTTKDGIPVVFHNEKLNGFTTCTGPVRNKFFSELQRCRYLLTGGRINTFEEVLKWSSGQIIVDAEFKDEASIAPALALVNQYHALSWVYFQTQNNRTKYHLARDADPDVVLLYKIDSEDDLQWVASLSDPALLIIEIDETMRNPQTIETLHSLKKLVTEDSFNHDKLKELFKAQCSKSFPFGIDIAVTNRTKSCLKQRPH